jgi:hypothetical protein
VVDCRGGASDRGDFDHGVAGNVHGAGRPTVARFSGWCISAAGVVVFADCAVAVADLIAILYAGCRDRGAADHR